MSDDAKTGGPGRAATPKSPGHERYEGVDAEFLAKDTWAEEEPGRPCPQCGYVAGATEIRCPRCRALLLMGCSGSCASCGAKRCERRG